MLATRVPSACRHLIQIITPVAMTATVSATVHSQTMLPLGASVSDDTVYVSVFANGNVKGSATTESKEATAGTGSLGLRIQRGNQTWTASVTVASSLDTLRDDFGAAVLTPGTGQALQSALLDVKFSGERLYRWGVNTHFYGSLGKHTWAFEDSLVRSAVVLGAGALFYRPIIDQAVGENHIGLSYEFGIAGRWLLGDAAEPGTEAYRNRVINTAGTWFLGPELGLEVRFGDVTAAIHWYRLWDTKEQKHVKGLTSGQLTAGFGLVADVFKGKAKRKRTS